MDYCYAMKGIFKLSSCKQVRKYSFTALYITRAELNIGRLNISILIILMIIFSLLTLKSLLSITSLLPLLPLLLQLYKKSILSFENVTQKSLEGKACYAGLLLTPAEGFRRVFFLACLGMFSSGSYPSNLIE